MVESTAGQEAEYEVVSPRGEFVMEPISMAPRLSTLEGKTIGEIWNGGSGGTRASRSSRGCYGNGIPP
jgi:hypothetical protein